MLFKGGLIFLAACGVTGQLVYKLFVPTVPATFLEHSAGEVPLALSSTA